MPYEQIESITSRANEKVLPYTTVPNLVGGGIGLGSAFALSSALGLSGPLQVVIFVIGIATGYLFTMEVLGMALYMRLYWRLRGVSQGWMGLNAIRPEELPGSEVQLRLTISLRGSPIRARTSEQLPRGRR